MKMLKTHRGNSRNSRFILGLLSLTVATGIIVNLKTSPLWAAGKKPGAGLAGPTGPATPGSGGAKYSTPSPMLLVRLPQIGTKVFPLPNGAQVDLNFDLQSILTTAVTSTSVFAPADPSVEDPCNSHLEIRSAVTTFQLDLVDAGVSIGFSPAGSLSSVTSITGAAKVKVGMIAMDFGLWQCQGVSCFAVTAATSTHAVVGGDITFEADFTNLKTAADLVFHPAMAATLRSIMADGMKQLVASPRLPEVAWTASVRDYNAVSGVLVLSVGEQSRLLLNQTFEIYAPTDATSQGVCNVFQTVAYVHTSAVNTVSSEAVIDQILDPRGVQKGDVVMVRNARNSSR